MAVYSDAKLTRQTGTLPQDTVVRVLAYAGKAARIQWSDGKGYAGIADMRSVDSVATKAVVTESAKVYQSASTSARSASVATGTRVYVLGYSGDWAMVEKDGTVGYMLLEALEPANADWSTGAPRPTPGPAQRAGRGGVLHAAGV